MPRLSSLHNSRFSIFMFRAHFLYTFPMYQSTYLAISLQSHALPCTFLQWHFNLITHFSFSPVKLMSTTHLWVVCMPTFSGCSFSLQLNRQIHVPLFLSVPVTANPLFALFTWHPCQCLCSPAYYIPLARWGHATRPLLNFDNSKHLVNMLILSQPLQVSSHCWYPGCIQRKKKSS